MNPDIFGQHGYVTYFSGMVTACLRPWHVCISRWVVAISKRCMNGNAIQIFIGHLSNQFFFNNISRFGTWWSWHSWATMTMLPTPCFLRMKTIPTNRRHIQIRHLMTPKFSGNNDHVTYSLLLKSENYPYKLTIYPDLTLDDPDILGQ